jgi:ADP-heptose:LPS heptosyltransferase
VISSPSEGGRAASIAAEGGARLVADGGVRDAMAIVATADVVFTPETSIAHVSTAFDTPAVVLQPRDEAASRGPYLSEGRGVESPTPRVADITVDEAVRALESRLVSRSAR